MAEKTEKVRAKVIGSRVVAETAPGGTVDLDPEEVNIPALVEAGHIEISKTAQARVERAEQGA
ncbi:hypothetical protein [Streptosporangium sp. NPDC048865]|uniref:hypothetical protein n=1 Tax=Streptosporangium sp. NPDC048865 TaxID=3155766 RepID=UPI003428C119